MSYNPSTDGSINNQYFKGSARSVVSGYQNATGSTLPMATPVAINSSGQLIAVDVSSQAVVQAIVGLTAASIPNAANGQVADGGRLENVSLAFSAGDALYVAKDGTLTNIKPDIGVGGFLSGDFVIFIGVMAVNEFNPSNFDIKLLISVIGEL